MPGHTRAQGVCKGGVPFKQRDLLKPVVSDQGSSKTGGARDVADGRRGSWMDDTGSAKV